MIYEIYQERIYFPEGQKNGWVNSAEVNILAKDYAARN